MSETKIEPIEWLDGKEELTSEGEIRRVEIQCVRPFMVKGQMVSEGQRVRGVPDFMAKCLVDRGRAQVLTDDK